MSNENISYMEVSSYFGKNKQADVVRSVGLNENNYWGVRFWINDNPLGIEWYPGKAEVYAEDSAENYTLGIKEYPGK